MKNKEYWVHLLAECIAEGYTHREAVQEVMHFFKHKRVSFRDVVRAEHIIKWCGVYFPSISYSESLRMRELQELSIEI